MGSKAPDVAQKRDADFFSVLTFNLRFGLADDGPNSWERRKHALAPLFNRHWADFIGLQEANDFQIRYLQKILDRYGSIGKRWPAPDFWQNNVIFYRKNWNCIDHRHLFLSPTPAIPSRFSASRWPRQCTIGLFEKSGRRLICINTHFDFESGVQEASARIVMSHLARFPDDITAIVMGDFNTTPEGPCYDIFTESNGSGGRGRGAFKIIYRKPYPPTFHGFTGRPVGGCIDWILYRGGLRLRSYRLLRRHFAGVYPSDHYPVRSEFEFIG